MAHWRLAIGDWQLARGFEDKQVSDVLQSPLPLAIGFQ